MPISTSDMVSEYLSSVILYQTRNYPLPGYILGVLTHTTAWDQNWGGGETLKGGFITKMMCPLRRF